jgi:hypothetical protein
VTEAKQTIDRLKRKVMWRARMLALQDYAAIVLIAGGVAATAIALYIKLKPIQIAWWPIPLAVFVLIAVAAVARWFKTFATERYAAFKIDRALDLEDRFTTAQAIIERGGPGSPIEDALVEDAARHIAKADESKIVPYRFARLHALSLLGVAALVTALAVPQRALPGGEELIAERANIENAGQQLEQTAEEVKQSVPVGTETASLAREQADLGRALRRTVISKADALKKLSALEERIRERHDELASTRADEIVSLAEKRLQPTLAPKPKEAQKQSATDQQAETSQIESGNESKPAQKDDLKASEPSAENKNPAEGKQSSDKQSSGKQSPSEPKRAETDNANGNRQTAADRKPSTGEAARKTGEKTGEQNKSQPPPESRSEKQNAQSQQASSESQSAEQQKAGEPQKAGEQQKAEAEKNPAAEVTGALAEQAGKIMPGSMIEQAAEAATPMLSDQLLKQAEQLRANQLTPENIRQLRQAAESLARDLAPIAQSKEFQQAVEQLARQINPEQLERVARELMSQENIRRELESAARLLMENRDVKEMVTGLGELSRSQAQANQQNESGADQAQSQTGSNGESNPRSNNSRDNGQGGRGGRGSQQRAPDEVKLSGQGKEVKQGGTIQRKPGGEYLYLQSKPGVGAARAPYSSAYPQYRREAERSVERSQVPQHMRSVIRKYFDAINPDTKKKE